MNPALPKTLCKATDMLSYGIKRKGWVNEFLSCANSRANSYRLLAECYYPPDGKLIKILNSIEESIGGLYSEIAKNIPGINGVELLKIDYSRLFVGPYKLLAPPYGSVYLEDARKVMGDSTMDVRNRYQEEGLDIGLKEAPDHIAVELEFMYFLIFKEIEAIKNSDSKSAVSYLKRQRSFLKTHLGRWVSEFAENVEANAQAEFYKNLARLTKSFIKKDMREMAKLTKEYVIFEAKKL